MDIKQLQAMGAFVPVKINKQSIGVSVPIQKPKADWSDPEVPEFTGETSEEKMDVFIRSPSSADELQIALAAPADRPFVAIQLLAVNEKGEQVFTLEEALILKQWLWVPLYKLINEVNSNLPKASRGKTSSGSKSRSRSADEAPKSGSTP